MSVKSRKRGQRLFFKRGQRLFFKRGQRLFFTLANKLDEKKSRCPLLPYSISKDMITLKDSWGYSNSFGKLGKGEASFRLFRATSLK